MVLINEIEASSRKGEMIVSSYDRKHGVPAHVSAYFPELKVQKNWERELAERRAK